MVPIVSICQKVIATGELFLEATRTMYNAIAHVEVAGIAINSNFVGIFHLNVPASRIYAPYIRTIIPVSPTRVMLPPNNNSIH